MELVASRDHLSPLIVLAAPDTSPLSTRLPAAHATRVALLARMCALQEQLDWTYYDALGLLADDERAALATAAAACPPPADDRYALAPGHRPFELLLSAEAAASGATPTWFTRNGYTDPARDPLAADHPLRPLIDARAAVIRTNRWLALLERPEYKRRWTLGDWPAEVRDACTTALLDAVEAEARRDTAIRTVRELCAAALRSERLRAVAALRFPGEDDLSARTAELVAADAVPFLTAARLTPAGESKRALWEATWALQRREDAGEALAEPIPVPPKYDREDYADPRYWTLRGRLDVPRERFISYPWATKDDDPSPLYGWAGWDHKQRADALAALYQQRKNEDGWTADRLTPLLSGLLECVPWVIQWGGAAEAGEDQSPGEAYRAYVEAEARELGVTVEGLKGWRGVAAAAKGKRGKRGNPLQTRCRKAGRDPSRLTRSPGNVEPARARCRARYRGTRRSSAPQ